MYGNFSRVTFDGRRHVSRVLSQQGMVTLDADDNERTAVELHQRRLLAFDLIGPHGTVAHAFKGQTTATRDDFQITGSSSLDFGITPGRYWVGGYPCELERPEDVWVPPDFAPVEDKPPAQQPASRPPPTFSTQPHHPEPPPAPEARHRYLVYLEAWERHVTSALHPDLRERALGDADTVSQARIVWQVKLLEVQPDDTTPPDSDNLKGGPERFLAGRVLARSRARLAVRALQQDIDEGECELPTEPRYRGPQNQLYRVEIHQVPEDNAPNGGGGRLSWKWSRDNGSVLYPVARRRVGQGAGGDSQVPLEHLGRDERTKLTAGTVVEPVSDRSELLQRPLPLLQVAEVDSYSMSVTLVPAEAGQDQDQWTGLAGDIRFLRRWDHQPLSGDRADEGRGLGGALPLDPGQWIPLEDGVQVWFKVDGRCRPGDYWVFSARTGAGNVEWPKVDKVPLLLPPHGVEHVFAPLALIAPTAAGVPPPAADYRRIIGQAL